MVAYLCIRRDSFLRDHFVCSRSASCECVCVATAEDDTIRESQALFRTNNISLRSAVPHHRQYFPAICRSSWQTIFSCDLPFFVNVYFWEYKPRFYWLMFSLFLRASSPLTLLPATRLWALPIVRTYGHCSYFWECRPRFSWLTFSLFFGSGSLTFLPATRLWTLPLRNNSF